MHRDSSPVYEALKIDGSQIKDHFGHPISPKVWSIVSDLSRDVPVFFHHPKIFGDLCGPLPQNEVVIFRVTIRTYDGW